MLVSEVPDRLVREGPMSSFDIDVTRDGGWWMVHIPELGGRTQAFYPPRGRAHGTRVHRDDYGNAYRPRWLFNWRRRTL